MEIITGPKGGKYWIDEDGKKHYVKARKVEKVNQLPSPAISRKKIQKNVMKKYICHYNVYDLESKDLIDDFKEWCNAYSKEEARHEFERRYSGSLASGRMSIAYIILDE